MVRVLGDEHIQLLDGGDNDAVRVEIAFFVPILQLSLQHRSAAVAVGRALLEPVVFLDGLVVQVLAVHHKQHLVNAGQGQWQAAPVLKEVRVLPLPVVCQM